MKNALLVLSMIISLNAQAGDFIPYVGVFGGTNKLSAKPGEADKNGFNVGAKLMGSYLMESVVLDGALGWQYNQMKGEIGNTSVTVKTKSIFLDLDARYRLTDSLSLGPTVSTHFGVDNTFSENVGGSSSTTLAGGKIAYDLGLDSKNPVRIEAALLKNITSLGRDNTVMNIGISIGFPWEKSKEQAPVARAEAPRPRVEEVKPLKPIKEEADVKLTLKFARIGFDTNDFTLDKEAKVKLQRLGKFLAANPQLFSRLKISGHTDERGGKVYNQRLSQDRADSVMKAFAEAGVDEKKMQAVGYGLSVPLMSGSTAEAYEKNRRTEIEFYGVSDRQLLNNKLEQLLKQQ